MEYEIKPIDKEDVELYSGFLFGGAIEEFGSPDVYPVGAFDEDTLIGVACVRAGARPALLSVAVSPDYERKGVGSSLVDYCAGLFMDNSIPYMEAVLFGTEEEREDDEMFLYRCGFDFVREYTDLLITASRALEVHEFSALADKAESLKHISFYSDLDIIQQRTVKTALTDQMLPDFTLAPGFLPGITACFLQDDKPVGFTVFSKSEDALVLDYAFVSDECKSGLALMEMLVSSLSAIIREFGKDQPIRIIAVNEKSEKLLSHFFSEESSRQKLALYSFDFKKEKEVPVRTARVKDEPLSDPDKPVSHFSFSPEFVPVGNYDYVCRNCVYRLEGHAFECHKYDEKPDAAIDGGPCPKYRAEMEDRS